MNINNYFNLNFLQHNVDFVNVRVDRDNKLFLDGRAIMASTDIKYFQMRTKYISFSRQVNSVLLNGTVKDKFSNLSFLFSGFSEAPYTRFGFCENGITGNGMGNDKLKKELIKMLVSNSALNSGALTGFHQIGLVVENVSVDRLSDATTQVLLKELAEYTLEQCELLGISSDFITSFTLKYYDDITNSWIDGDFYLPYNVILGKKYPLILVPKDLVRDAGSAARSFNQFLGFLFQGPLLGPGYFNSIGLGGSGKNGNLTKRDKTKFIANSGGKSYIANQLATQNSNKLLMDFESQYHDLLPPALTDEELENIVNCRKKTGCDLAS